MGIIEDIILRHGSRGMNILRKYLEPNYCMNTAAEILTWKRGNVFLATGFYVAGFAETDGPAGTVTVAKTLEGLGFHPIILTDKFCDGFFEMRGLDVIYMGLQAGEEFAANIIRQYNPVGMISIERCGINIRDDYENMRGISIADNTAKIDLFFEAAGKEGIPTVGVGDGGNEIGMGNVEKQIRLELSLVPCRVKTDRLVIASVSNWGAYGIAAYLARMTKRPELFPDFITVEKYISDTVKLGSVDGVTHEHKVGVDGFDMTVEKEILDALKEAVNGAAAEEKAVEKS